MTTTTTTGAAVLTAAEVAQLFVQPLLDASVAAQVATTVSIGTATYRIPRVKADPSAAWIAEGAEIAPSDATLDELLVTPSKLAGLTIITRELADDSSPQAAQVVGDGLARDCARKLDLAFFGALPAPAPAGLASLTGATGATVVSAGTNWTNVDAFTEGIYAAAARNAVIGAWVANPADALALSKIKQQTGSQVALLQPDATAAGRSLIAGAALFTSPAVAAGTVYGIDPASAHLVIRDDVQIERDDSVFFTSDRVAVRARLRAGFAFPDAKAIVRITKGS